MNPAKQNEISAYHWILFLICFLGTAFAGTVSTLMSVYLPVAVRDLLGTEDENRLNTISAYINSVFIYGGALGGFISGIISDRSGRKTGVIFSIACYGLFTVLTAVMPNWWGVVICRFFSGFGLGGVLVTTVTLMLEVWPEKSRTIFIGILSISIPVGIFSAGVIDYFVHSWREGFLIGLFPLIIAVLSLRFLKESPKWIAIKRERKREPDTFKPLFSGHHAKELFYGSVIFGSMLIGLWAIFSWLPTWIQSLVVSGDAQRERGISMMIMGMGGLAGGAISGWVMKFTGVKKALLICFGVCALSSVLLFKTNLVFHPVLYAEICLIAFFFGISQGVLSVYIPALFPVEVRGAGTGFCFNSGRIITATAVLFVGILVTVLGGYSNSLLVFSSVFVIGFIVTAVHKDISAEDSTREIQGDHAEQHSVVLPDSGNL